jgi:hypothetical protein
MRNCVEGDADISILWCVQEKDDEKKVKDTPSPSPSPPPLSVHTRPRQPSFSVPSFPLFRKVVRGDVHGALAFALMYEAYARLGEALEEDGGRTKPHSILRARLLFGQHEVLVEMDAVVGGKELTYIDGLRTRKGAVGEGGEDENDDEDDDEDDDEAEGRGGWQGDLAANRVALRDVLDGVVWLASRRIVYTDIRGPNALVVPASPATAAAPAPGGDGGKEEEQGGAAAANAAFTASAPSSAPSSVTRGYLVDYDDCVVVEAPVRTVEEYEAALAAYARTRTDDDLRGGFVSNFLAHGKRHPLRRHLAAAFKRARERALGSEEGGGGGV